jgi:hypothetical protein
MCTTKKPEFDLMALSWDSWPQRTCNFCDTPAVCLVADKRLMYPSWCGHSVCYPAIFDTRYESIAPVYNLFVNLTTTVSDCDGVQVKLACPGLNLSGKALGLSRSSTDFVLTQDRSVTQCNPLPLSTNVIVQLSSSTVSTDSATEGMSALLSTLNVTSRGCETGYSGAACRECVRPGFYRLGDNCKPCPKAAYGAILLLVVVLGTWCYPGDSKCDRRDIATVTLEEKAAV